MISETYSQLIKHFPAQYSPRPIQDQILIKIAEGLDQGKHTILLDAGTGVGKSAIAVTLSNYFDSAYIVTVTKQLQDQYQSDFGFQVLKGRNNWDCRAAPQDEDKPRKAKCDDGLCQVRSADYKCAYGVTNSDIKEDFIAFTDSHGKIWSYRTSAPCSYWDQKSTAINSNITLMNYASFFPEINYLPHFSDRVLNVFDEAHNLDDQIMQQMSINLSNQRFNQDSGRVEGELEKLGSENDLSPAELGDLLDKIPRIPRLTSMDYTEDLDHILTLLKELKKSYNGLASLSDLSTKTKKHLTSMALKLDTGIKELEEHPHEWIIDPNSTHEKIRIKPIEVNRFCGKYFFDHSNYNLLMSATILDKGCFSKWHGLNPDDVIYIHVKSPFNKKHRPIIIDTAGPMSNKYIETTKPLTIPKVQGILEKHKNEKGLIHTHNHKLAVYLYDTLKDPRIMIYSFNGRRGPRREDVIKKFIKSEEPKVLVAPSVDEGIDLPGDLCRFQIIYKVPFPYLGDKQIMARKKKDPDWYAYKTVTSLVQAYGRGMRNEDDHCHTYIMDGSIDGVLTQEWMKCRKFLPEYFVEAIQFAR